jgi:hypothetical protein
MAAATKKPRLVIMGSKEYHIEDFVADFKNEFEYSVNTSPPQNPPCLPNL